ncbi:hypothetical protein [Dactylosporangium sp. NPDC000521]|uniref:hypothetical protein n=1 Tax=Dactylosporangium sp. NPDC000521 TaxID=3363975 RepID=UPI0036BDB6E7
MQRFRDHGGGTKPAQGGFKACYARTDDEALRLASDRWSQQGLPGELAQVLTSPRHFEQATTLVQPEMLTDQFALGPDPGRHLAMIERYVDAGFDEVYVANIGPHHRGFFDLYAKEVLPRVKQRERVGV